jgi:peptidyl-prolyl cis-trans isomerase A (cyclophilin A)
MAGTMSLIRTLILALFLPALVTQTPEHNGRLTGTVTDARGGALPGVEVSVTSAQLLVPSTAVTDRSGRYDISLPPGTYGARYAVTGFLTAVESAIVVTVDASVERNVSLKMVGPCDDCFPGLLFHGVVVRVETSLGNIDIAVDSQHAPLTSANFLKYVDGGLYNNGRFHRATRADNYVVNLPNRPLLECIQAGINPDMKARAFPPIPLERTSVTGLRHSVGVVSMARGADADTATSDFFILLNNQPSLDYGGKRFDDNQGAAAFGYVSMDSMDVVRKIQQQPTELQALKSPVRVISAKRLMQQ